MLPRFKQSSMSRYNHRELACIPKWQGSRHTRYWGLHPGILGVCPVEDSADRGSRRLIGLIEIAAGRLVIPIGGAKPAAEAADDNKSCLSAVGPAAENQTSRSVLFSNMFEGNSIPLDLSLVMNVGRIPVHSNKPDASPLLDTPVCRN
jgi:hypothetical protein